MNRVAAASVVEKHAGLLPSENPKKHSSSSSSSTSSTVSVAVSSSSSSGAPDPISSPEPSVSSWLTEESL